MKTLKLPALLVLGALLATTGIVEAQTQSGGGIGSHTPKKSTTGGAMKSGVVPHSITPLTPNPRIRAGAPGNRRGPLRSGQATTTGSAAAKFRKPTPSRAQPINGKPPTKGGNGNSG